MNRRTFLGAAAATVAIEPSLAHLAHIAARRSADLEVAVIGLGRQGRQVLAELATFEGISVTAICDTDESRLSSGLRRAKGATGFSDHRELLERQASVQVVIVATPTHEHRTVALAALAAGKHVYCEAPLAHTIEDARAIAQEARKAQGVFQVGLQGRSNPVYSLARDFAVSGAIKDWLGARAQYHKKTTWRQRAPKPELELARNWRLDPSISTGLLGEEGVHQFDVVHWYRNSYPVAVQARGAILAHKDGREVPDTVQASFEFEDGSGLEYSASLGNSFEGRYEVFYGSNAAIKLAWSHGWMFKEADSATQGWEVYANRQQFHNDEGITLIANATQLADQGKLQDGVGLPESPLWYALSDFFASITDETPVTCSAEEGMRATIVALCAKRAADEGTRIEIDRDLLRVE